MQILKSLYPYEGTWKLINCTSESLGFIPGFLRADDPRPAKEQFNERYIAGWDSFNGFTMLPDGNMQYGNPDNDPECDPPTILLAECEFRNELIRFYDSAWVAIVQKDGSFEVCRMD